MIDVDNMKNWKQAAMASGKGRLIYNQILKDINKYSKQGQAYRKIVDQNAYKIKTLPHTISESVTRQVSKLSIEGMRSSDIAKEIIKKFPQSSKASAKLIARTETSKATTALTRVRSEELGADWYVWRTSKDQRVRRAHAHMEGVLCQFSQDPSPELLDGKPSEGTYAPGEIYNCRCYPEPLISLNLVQWPHKILLNGKISMITRSKFEALLSYKQPVKVAPGPTSTSQYAPPTPKVTQPVVKQPKVPKAPVLQPQAITTPVPNVQAPNFATYKFHGRDESFQDHKIHDAYITYMAKGPKEEIIEYTGSSYRSINEAMRNNNFTGVDKAGIDKMKKEIAGSPALLEDTIIYRHSSLSCIERFFNAAVHKDAVNMSSGRPGTNKAASYIQSIERVVSGATFSDAAFLSTSHNTGVFVVSGGVEIQIYLPKGFKNGLYVSTISQHTSEREFIINAGQEFRVMGVDYQEIPSSQSPGKTTFNLILKVVPK